MKNDTPLTDGLGRKLRIVSVTTMFPHPGDPMNGLFVERRIEALARRAELVALVPVPFFPLVSRLVPQYRARREIPRRARGESYDVVYPRYFSVPRFLKPLDGFSVAICLWWQLRRLRRAGFRPDILDCHLAYPEGFAGILLRRWFGFKVVVTLRGHDINELPKYPVRKRQVELALARADRIFSVAGALAEAAITMGAPRQRTSVSPNGVDLERFKVGDRSSARSELGLPPDRPIVLSIGYLVARKGFDHLIEGLALLVRRRRPAPLLVIVGGPGGEAYVKPELDRLVESLALHEHVRFVGPRPNEELPLWYQACDVFALLSSKEGRPNVVIEALACGRPVVATRAWGIPELVSSEDLGLLVPSPPSPEETASAIGRALDQEWSERRVSAEARERSWNAVARQLDCEMHALVSGALH